MMKKFEIYVVKNMGSKLGTFSDWDAAMELRRRIGIDNAVVVTKVLKIYDSMEEYDADY